MKSQQGEKGETTMAQSNADRVSQAVVAEIKRRVMRRLWWWVLAGGGGVLGWGLVILIGAVASVTLLAGTGQWFANLFGPSPPAIATEMSRPAEWLNLATVEGAPLGVPNVLALAVMNAASDGEAYGDRYYCSNQQSAGESCRQAYHPGVLGIGPHGVTTLGIGYGLMGIDSQRGLIPAGQSPHATLWNVATGLKALAHDLRAGWQAGLTTFHQTVQTPPGWRPSGSYATQIRGLVQSYDAGPTLGAWALAPWSHKTGQFTDPGHQPEWVFVVGTAPIGPAGTAAWAPPTTVRTRNPKTGQVTVTTQTHAVHYQDLGEPLQVWGTTQSGHHVAFELSSVPGSTVPVWSGGVVWGARVPLTGPNQLVMIHAQWSNGVRDTINWPEQASGAVGTVQLISNTQALHRWWAAIGAAATHTAGTISVATLEDAIGAVMLHESGGNPTLYANGNPHGAYGLMQLEPATARGLPGYVPGARHNPQENLRLGAELLTALYDQTHSWHMTFAEYYNGSLPPNYHPGMTWAQIAPAENFVPAGGNTETVAAYADAMVAEMALVKHQAPTG